MKDRFDRCSTWVDKRKDVRREKGKTFTLKNDTNKRVRHVQVDDCLLTGSKKRCDFLYEIIGNSAANIERVLFVELKGKDFSHGKDQLENTIRKLRSFYEATADKQAFLIGRAIPSFQTKLQKTKLYFKRTYNVTFIAKTNCWEESV